MRQLPDDIFYFVKKYIDSVELLEILLLTYRNPEKPWTINSVSQEIRTSKTSTQNRLSSLLLNGLIVVAAKKNDEISYRYQAVSDDLHEQVVKLEQEYKIKRMRVIDAIYAPPAEEKMMNFLDAFKIRKNDKDE